MTIRVSCTGCKKTVTAPDEAAGKRVRCPACKTIVQVPAAAPPPAPKAPSPKPVSEPEPLPEQAPDLSALEAPTDSYELRELPADYVNPSASAGGAAKPGPATKTCPACGEKIPQQALKCQYCGEILNAALKKEAFKSKAAASGGDSDSSLSGVELVFAALCGGIACIVGIVWVIQGKPKGGKLIAASLVFSLLWKVLGAIIVALTNK